MSTPTIPGGQAKSRMERCGPQVMDVKAPTERRVDGGPAHLCRRAVVSALPRRSGQAKRVRAAEVIRVTSSSVRALDRGRLTAREAAAAAWG